MPNSNLKLRKTEILRGRKPFQSLLREGFRVRGRGVTLFFLPSSRRRFGMIVPLRPFGNAVKRNYGRRRIREFYRNNKHLFPDCHDTLIRLYIAPTNWERFFEHIVQLLETHQGPFENHVSAVKKDSSDSNEKAS